MKKRIKLKKIVAKKLNLQIRLMDVKLLELNKLKAFLKLNFTEKKKKFQWQNSGMKNWRRNSAVDTKLRGSMQQLGFDLRDTLSKSTLISSNQTFRWVKKISKSRTIRIDYTYKSSILSNSQLVEVYVK